MRTARPAISGNQLASTGKFECRNFSNFRLCHAIFPICSISSNIISSKTVLEYILVLLIRKTAALSKCNGVFFSVKIGTVELRKSNILAPKHGGDGVILASVIWLPCSVHIIQVSGLCIEFFNNSAAILNFEHIAMHCGLSRVILLF